MQTIEIIPAVLPLTYGELERALERLESSRPKWIQIDVMDKSYTHNATWPYAMLHDTFFDQLKKEELALIGWESSRFEIDMMMRDPEKHIDDWVRAGASRFILHLGALTNPEMTLRKLQEEYGIEGEWKIDILIAVSPFEKVESINPLLPFVDGVQVMGIDPVGVQGSLLLDSVYDTIKDIRAITDKPIAVDGGVNLDNVHDLVVAGATRLVSGSFILGYELGPKEAIKELYSNI